MLELNVTVEDQMDWEFYALLARNEANAVCKCSLDSLKLNELPIRSCKGCIFNAISCILGILFCWYENHGTIETGNLFGIVSSVGFTKGKATKLSKWMCPCLPRRSHSVIFQCLWLSRYSYAAAVQHNPSHRPI